MFVLVAREIIYSANMLDLVQWFLRRLHISLFMDACNFSASIFVLNHQTLIYLVKWRLIATECLRHIYWAPKYFNYDNAFFISHMVLFAFEKYNGMYLWYFIQIYFFYFTKSMSVKEDFSYMWNFNSKMWPCAHRLSGFLCVYHITMLS